MLQPGCKITSLSKKFEKAQMLLEWNKIENPSPEVASSQKSFATTTYPKQTPSVTLPIANEREHNAQVGFYE